MLLHAIIPARLVLLLAAVFCCSFHSIGQPVSIPMRSTSPPALPNTTIASTAKNISLSPIYTLFTSSTAACIPGACVALPLTLLDFSGERLDPDHVQLHWKTTNEVNNAGFYVERSLGNTSQFYSAGFVPAGPDSTLVKLYQFPDLNSYPGTTYYRLRELDIDSQFVYSKTISIDNTGQPQSLLLYPNPTHDILNLRIVMATAANSRIQLCDIQGRVLLSQETYLLRGLNYLNFNVSGLPAGKYFVQVRNYSSSGLISSFLKN